MNVCTVLTYLFFICRFVDKYSVSTSWQKSDGLVSKRFYQIHGFRHQQNVYELQQWFKKMFKSYTVFGLCLPFLIFSWPFINKYI
jgi:hypothetical protein